MTDMCKLMEDILQADSSINRQLLLKDINPEELIANFGVVIVIDSSGFPFIHWAMLSDNIAEDIFASLPEEYKVRAALEAYTHVGFSSRFLCAMTLPQQVTFFSSSVQVTNGFLDGYNTHDIFHNLVVYENALFPLFLQTQNGIEVLRTCVTEHPRLFLQAIRAIDRHQLSGGACNRIRQLAECIPENDRLSFLTPILGEQKGSIMQRLFTFGDHHHTLWGMMAPERTKGYLVQAALAALPASQRMLIIKERLLSKIIFMYKHSINSDCLAAVLNACSEQERLGILKLEYAGKTLWDELPKKTQKDLVESNVITNDQAERLEGLMSRCCCVC